MRPKTCKQCGEKFIPERHMQACCSIPCAIDYGRMQSAREDRKATKMKLENMKPLSHFADKAQRVVNAWIRERDKGEPCISCGRHHEGKWNAGHYISRGRSPALRYHPDNIHKQCEPCNTSLSGNLVEYRKRLIEKIGIDRVGWLEQEHSLPRWRREDYERIEAEAKAKLKGGNA